jgi:YD repeat-containing protein
VVGFESLRVISFNKQASAPGFPTAKPEDGPWTDDAATNRWNTAGLTESISVDQPSTTNYYLYTNSFTFSPANDLVVLLDGKANRTMWLYDAEGRMQVKTNQANAIVQTNGYNANGELTARWTPAKGMTAFHE